jgi:ABC-type polysaccharide/polyol phosphate transport system ATPase subunit
MLEIQGMSLRRRGCLQNIQSRLRDNPVVGLVGTRQAGKTTLARMFAESSPCPCVRPPFPR